MLHDAAKRCSAHEAEVWSDLCAGRSTSWVNCRARRSSADVPAGAAADGAGAVVEDAAPVQPSDVEAAARRWQRFRRALSALFPNQLPDGTIQSPLLRVPTLARRHLSARAPSNTVDRVFVKADDRLPLAGSVKARGGFYEVLRLAERIGLQERLLNGESDDYAELASAAARRVFARYTLHVASTGNLGYAVGLLGRALGFATTVHMSNDAKSWKKERLRRVGATVNEYPTDYTQAVCAARAEAAAAPRSHFVDDERSMELFLGYAAVAAELAQQLRDHEVVVDAMRPLFLHLPCGVGGAPGGVLYGLRTMYGENVQGLFVEPVEAPCMLMRLIDRLPREASVYDLHRTNRTIADGLAVARASELVVRLVGRYVAGGYTVTDDELLAWTWRAHTAEGLRLEPAAAAGFVGAFTRAWETPAFAPDRERLAAGTHVIWATGGSLMPMEEFEANCRRGAIIAGS